MTLSKIKSTLSPKSGVRGATTITRYAFVLSLFTLLAYHLPLARYVISHVEAGFNGWVIAISFAVLILFFFII
jgi:hypothetical protein